MYINGQQMANTSTTNAGDLTKISDTRIGYGFNGWGWNGFIDDVKIYPYARSAAQIAQDYTTGKSGQSSSKGTNTSFGSFSPKSLSDGLVGYWKFDEGVGTTSADSSGNSNTATFGSGSSAPSWGNGKYGIGLSFGANNYIYAQDNANLPSGTTPVTMSAWVQFNSSGLGIYQGLISQTDNSFELNKSSTNALRIEMRYSDSSVLRAQELTPSLTQANHWYFVTATFQPQDGTVNLYVDGSPRQVSYVDTKVGGNINNPSSPVYFGSRASNDLILNGSLDEVRIYNRTLSSAEITALYNYSPGPVGYWKMDENSGNIANDSSGNNYQATLQNGASFSNGKFGHALTLNIGDTTNQYATIPSINHNYAFTKEAWINPSTFSCQGSRCSVIGPYLEVLSNLQYYDYSFSNPGWHTGGSIPLNQWSHIAISYDLANIKLYVNGTQVLNTAVGSTNTHYTNMIGALGSNSRNFRGKIDDLKIYNYARTQEQIIQDMQGDTTSTKIASPIAWYKFDEGQGTLINNSGIGGSAFNANFATGSSAPTWDIGKSNKGLNFNGINNYAKTNQDPVNSLQELTISAWIKVDSSDTTGPIAGNTFGYYYRYGIYVNSGSYMAYFRSATGLSTLDSSTQYSPNSWDQVTVTYDNGNAKIYVNGKLKNSSVFAYAPLTENTSWITFGTHYPDSGNFFKGLIDDVKIYNYALSPDEIKTDYNQSSSVAFGVTNLTVGNTSNSTLYCVPGSTDPCSPPVAEWKFDEGVGTTAYDTSGNNKNMVFGTGSSAPTWTTGKIGKALKFNGTTNYLSTPDNSALTPSIITVSVWIKPLSLPSSGGIYGIIDKRDASGTAGYVLELYNSSGTQKIAWVSGLNGPVISYTLPINQWSHLTAVQIGTTATIYVNGINIGSASADTLTNYTTSLNIGKRIDNKFFPGLIDQVRIYNYARTPAQIAWDYNQGAPIAWWKLDECQGSIAHDSSGLGNTGAINIGPSGTQNSLGTCQVGTSAAWTNGATGKLNSSLNFDGSDDYVEVTDNDIYSSNQFSINSWIKWDGIRYAGATSNDWGAIVTKGNYNSGEYTLLINRDSASINNNINLYINGGQRVQWTPTLDTNWHLLTVTYDGSYAKIYFDGQYKNQGAYSALITNTTNNLRLGRQINGSYKWGGQLDDVRIYNYALTQEQIKQIYNGGAINFN